MTNINITPDGIRTSIASPIWLPYNEILQRAVIFQPGYNSDRDAPPSRNYGVHGMGITWCLRGPKGAACFKISTDWIPGELSPGHGLDANGMSSIHRLFPMGTDVGYHARNPQWEGQEQCAHGECHLIDGRCYYDGSGLEASDLIKEFILEGESVVWKALETVYRDLK